MTFETLLGSFNVIADAPNGVQKIREVILQLAVRGKLVPQSPEDEPASALLERIAATAAGRHGKTKIDKLIASPPFHANEPPEALPAGWTWTQLSRMGEFCGGSTPSKSEARYWGGSVVWVSPKDMKTPRIANSEDKVTEHALAESNLRLIPPKSLLIVTRSGILRRKLPTAVNDVPCTLNQDLKALIPHLPELVDYLAILLAGFESEILRRFVKGGTTVQSLVFERFASHLVPLPPLAEQRRIVVKVRALMSLCDQLEERQRRRTELRTQVNRSTLHALATAHDVEGTTTHWDRLRANFVRIYEAPEEVAGLRKAVLQLAVLGRLVRQDASDQPASALLEQIAGQKDRLSEDAPSKDSKDALPVSQAEMPYRIPEGWSCVRAGELLSFVTSGSRGWAQYYSNTGALFLRIGNLDYDSIALDLRSVQRVKLPTDAEGARTRVSPGDILISITGDTGMVGLVPPGFEEAYINQHVALARPATGIHPEWLARYFSSPIARQYLVGAQRGIKNSLGLDDIRAIPVLLPPSSEQQRIASRLAELLSLCDALEKRLLRGRDSAARLARAVERGLSAA